jgi:hypothetical protein
MWMGFILFLFLTSFIIISFIFFSHDLNTLNQTREIEVYQSEHVRYFNAFGYNTLRIEVEFNLEVDEKYLLMYGYYYFDKYHENIHLLNSDNNLILTISEKGYAELTTYV